MRASTTRTTLPLSWRGLRRRTSLPTFFSRLVVFFFFCGFWFVCLLFVCCSQRNWHVFADCLFLFAFLVLYFSFSHTPHPLCRSQHAMFLEDEGRFQEAEDEFIKAGKPKEAVLMYVHVQDWDGAQRVAEKFDKER